MFLIGAMVLAEIMFFPYVIYREVKAFRAGKKCRALKVYSLALSITALIASCTI